ncbi:MAG: RNA polymerase sigma-70 factor [Bacteroidales bacterium]|jgi:RNA polymerase sigma-70 factor (ECF subfamily)|nr:RNA polymerase sigma-70 factor [Bacteroidales bacterium]
MLKPILPDIDLSSFESIYNAYFPVLYNYVVTIVKDRTEAEDIVSDVFLKLWEEKDNIAIRTSVKAYLFKSSYNQSINVLKRKKVHERYENYFQHLALLAEADPDYPLSQLIEKELTGILTKTIEKLPQQCRVIFNMSRNDGLTHEEIAQQLGVSVNTVHMQIRRALKKLRVELRDFLPLLLLYISTAGRLP